MLIYFYIGQEYGNSVEALREFSFGTVCLRLVLATLCGGLIGYGRTKKNRAAGLRTYMLTSAGAALAVLISLYEFSMLEGPWASVAAEVGLHYDVSRVAAQVISGISFLAAGSIISVAHRQVYGLTTATGLFASVCMGIAAGAGFYECVAAAVFFIAFALEGTTNLDLLFKRRTRNITMAVEFDDITHIDAITKVIEEHADSIHSIDIEHSESGNGKHSSVIYTVRMKKHQTSHSHILSYVAELPWVYSVEEVIA